LSLQVSPARAEEQAAALRLFFQHLAGGERETRVERVLALVANGELPPESLLVCRAGETLFGAMVALPMPGAAGLVWPPQAVGGAGPETIEDLLGQAAILWLRQRGSKFAQALLAVTDSPSALLRNGFRHTTTLLYLQKSLEGSDDSSAASGRLHWQTYAECDRAAFQRALLASYEETLDCPELNGLRTVEEIIAGYQAVPGCRLDRWWLAWHEDRPVGVLITAAAQDQATWELVYVGLVPAARRQGLGPELTRKALGEARASGATRVMLTVDVRNQPARRMYAALGFEENDRRDVYLVVLAAPLRNS